MAEFFCVQESAILAKSFWRGMASPRFADPPAPHHGDIAKRATIAEQLQLISQLWQHEAAKHFPEVLLGATSIPGLLMNGSRRDDVEDTYCRQGI